MVLIVIDSNPQAYSLRLAINGFSHGLTNCPPDSLLPRLRRGRPFESATPVKTKNTTQRVVFFVLAEDEGFEPPQTESESGVLPLHKSSIYGGDNRTRTCDLMRVKHAL